MLKALVLGLLVLAPGITIAGEGVFDPSTTAITGAPQAVISSCQKYMNESERVADCRQKQQQAITALKGRGFTILAATDCVIDTGPMRFCDSFDSVPRAVGIVVFLH
jgi:hypothetical protein